MSLVYVWPRVLSVFYGVFVSGNSRLVKFYAVCNIVMAVFASERAE